MRVIRALGVVLLLMAPACARHEAPPPPPKPQAVAPDEPADDVVASPEPGPAPSHPETRDREAPSVPQAPAKPAGMGEGLSSGMSRADFMAAEGACMERVSFHPGGAGALTLEVFQPKAGKCRDKLGEHQYVIAGAKLIKVRPGLYQMPPPPPPPKPDERR